MASRILLASSLLLVAAMLLVPAIGHGMEEDLLVQRGSRVLLQAKVPAPKVPVLPVAKTYTVGGLKGWVLNFQWPLRPKARVARKGDKLVFKWTGPIPHNVLLFKNATTYRNCNFAGARFLSAKTGYTYVLPTAKTTYFFGCSIGQHCKIGKMKFNITTA
jgi:hypothetical protein